MARRAKATSGRTYDPGRAPSRRGVVASPPPWESSRLGPLPAVSLVWQPRPGAWVLTVVAKATFVLRPGEAVLATTQEAPTAEDRHQGDDPGRALHAPRDQVPAKPLADVLLVGSAFAADRRPTRSLVARLVVGELDKSLEILADRWLGAGGAHRRRALRADGARLRAGGGRAGHDQPRWPRPRRGTPRAAWRCPTCSPPASRRAPSSPPASDPSRPRGPSGKAAWVPG